MKETLYKTLGTVILACVCIGISCGVFLALITWAGEKQKKTPPKQNNTVTIGEKGLGYSQD